MRLLCLAVWLGPRRPGSRRRASAGSERRCRCSERFSCLRSGAGREALRASEIPLPSRRWLTPAECSIRCDQPAAQNDGTQLEQFFHGAAGRPGAARNCRAFRFGCPEPGTSNRSHRGGAENPWCRVSGRRGSSRRCAPANEPEPDRAPVRRPFPWVRRDVPGTRIALLVDFLSRQTVFPRRPAGSRLEPGCWFRHL